MTTSSATTPLKQIICIKWGKKFAAEYVNKLYGMVSRNITPPFRFVCFTDDTDGIRPEVECQPLPIIDYTIPVGTSGQWGKSRLWSKQLGDLSGNVLFMDLDLVIVDNIDGFFDYLPEQQVVMTRNITNPLEKLGQTSLFRFRVGCLYPLQQQFSTNQMATIEKYRYEQRFVTKNAPNGVFFYPKGWVKHFRYQCRRNFPLNYVLPPKKPVGTKIVIFAGGELNPPEAIAGKYHPDYPSDMKAYLNMLKTSPEAKKKPLRHLRYFILPSKWVEEAWRE